MRNSFPFGSFKFNITIDKNFFRNRINFYKELHPIDKKGLTKYLFLSRLQYIIISSMMYYFIMGVGMLLTFDGNVEGSMLGFTIGFTSEWIYRYLIYTSIYILWITFITMTQRYLKLYDNFKKWDYMEFPINNYISYDSTYLKFFKWDLMKITKTSWENKKTYSRNESEYLHLLKYDQDYKTQMLREKYINDLI